MCAGLRVATYSTYPGEALISFGIPTVPPACGYHYSTWVASGVIITAHGVLYLVWHQSRWELLRVFSYLSCKSVLLLLIHSNSLRSSRGICSYGLAVRCDRFSFDASVKNKKKTKKKLSRLWHSLESKIVSLWLSSLCLFPTALQKHFKKQWGWVFFFFPCYRKYARSSQPSINT